MEKEQWITTILNSTNGMTAVEPNDAVLFTIQKRIKQQETVSLKTVWMVAASVAVLAMINVALVNNSSFKKDNSTAVYFENTLNKSNQLY